MKRNPLLLTLLAAALLVTVSQAQTKIDKDYHHTFTDETKTRQLTFEVPAMTTKARLRVKMHIKSGKASWGLRDPNGVTRINGEGRGQINTDTGELEAITGAWVLEIKLEHATGSGQVNWSNY